MPALASRVDPDLHLLFEWEAFLVLSSERQIGLGIGPIPWSSIELYADREGITDTDERVRFHHLIRAMDAVFLEHVGRDEPPPSNETGQ